MACALLLVWVMALLCYVADGMIASVVNVVRVGIVAIGINVGNGDDDVVIGYGVVVRGH